MTCILILDKIYLVAARDSAKQLGDGSYVTSLLKMFMNKNSKNIKLLLTVINVSDKIFLVTLTDMSVSNGATIQLNVHSIVIA
ncbi:hypothetical protein KCA1_1888 [Lactiplantibacillus pentosus KCA1]|nr:hypothetical protein KCA1_1888 [Lactiplantibacillus pentosus KCA1]